MSAAQPFADTADLLAALGRLGNALIERAQTAGLAAPATGGVAGSLPGDLVKGTMSLRAERVAQAWAELDGRGAATVATGRFVPWLQLTALFQLTRDEQTLLLAAFLPEMDARYGPILATLAGQAAAADGSVPLAAVQALLDGDGGGGRAVLARALGQDGTVLDWQILELSPGSDVLSGRGGCRLTPTLAAYLLGQGVPRPRWDEPLPDIALDRRLDDLALPAAVRERAAALATRWRGADGGEDGYVVQVQAVDQSAAETLCAALFDSLGLVCVRLDAGLLRRDRGGMAGRLRVLCRDALLAGRALVLTGAHALSPDGEEDLLPAALATLMSSHRHLAVVNGPAWRVADLAHHHSGHRVVPVALTLPRPDAGQRRTLWRHHAGREGVPLPDALVERLVAAYPLTETQIATALKETAARRLLGEDDTEAALVAACRAQTEHERLALAREVRTPHRLGDVVLPAATAGTLNEVLLHARHRDRVMEEWGFAAKTHEGRNLCVLFHGPPGTGKTMAASALANELGLGIYRIDLASVLSKYIGETEQRLAQLFDQAEAMNIVLFFDEAESLFAKRTDTGNANDRHANLQTGYLLQRIETYPGIVVLSTNLLKNLDPAFTRRFQFIVEFPFPGAAERLALWRGAFPAETPLADDLDLPLLADKAVLTGGHILSAAIAAALHAVEDGTAVTMAHALTGVRREYDKLGKVFATRDFRWPEEE